MKKLQNICVFCGSQMGHNPIFQQTAVSLAETLVTEDISLTA